MRLFIRCQDRLKLTRHLLDALAENRLILPDIIRTRDGVLTHFHAIEKAHYQAIIDKLATLPGVQAISDAPACGADTQAFAQIIATSDKMRALAAQVRKFALSNAPLLITGETGTGKDLMALACHQASPRAARPYLAINCAAIPSDVVESEMFGHAPGAYASAMEGKTGFFEQANGGSVLLDEIGEMSPAMQAKLLRFLNDGTFRRVGEDHQMQVDVRIICATQKNLEALVQKGQFRDDLYYRLKVLTLELPALRHCPQDILPLAQHFIALFATEMGITPPNIASDLQRVLTSYHWPGNVRQLKNMLYGAMTRLTGNELRARDMPLPEFTPHQPVTEEALAGGLDDIISRFERDVLFQLYQDYPSTRKLAQRLKVSHTAVANKLREYGIGNQRNPTNAKGNAPR